MLRYIGVISDMCLNVLTVVVVIFCFFFFFNDTATTEIYTLSLHDALPIFEQVDEIGFVRFSAVDVVRHPLVAKIVQAYDKDAPA